MGSILDEFDFLIEEEIETTFEEDSEQLVNEVKRFKEKSIQYPKATYQGIKVGDLCECINFGETEIAPWEHTYFTIDLGILKDITNNKLKELFIPSFIEEVRRGNTEFNEVDIVRNNISHINIPKNIIVIAPDTFIFYRKLENVKFEKESKLIYLGEKAFAFCEKLHKLDLRNCKELDSLPSNLIQHSSVEILKISSNIREIKEDTFNNTVLKKIYIDREEYTFEDFMEKLSNNNFKAFW